jgi:hypothetical protein
MMDRGPLWRPRMGKARILRTAYLTSGAGRAVQALADDSISRRTARLLVDGASAKKRGRVLSALRWRAAGRPLPGHLDVCSFVKNYKAKQMTDNIFAQ